MRSAAASHLEINTSGICLSPQDRARITQFKSWFKVKRLEAMRGPFRFLDLPAELRSRIYTFIFLCDDIESHNLSRFKLPPVTRASKQLRHESLPLFFSVNLFHVAVKSNLNDRTRARVDPTYPRNGSAHTGVLELRAPVKQIVHRAGPSALIRDIQFIIISDATSVLSSKGRGYDHYAVATFTLTVNRGELRVGTEEGRMHPDGTGLPFFMELFTAADVNAAVADATAAARAISSRDGFVGLTLADLQVIAKKFRFKHTPPHR